MKTFKSTVIGIRLGTCALLGAALVFGLGVQESHAAGRRVREVNRRFENQQDRIAAGINSGALTPREAANLERREAALKAQERADRAASGGHLTRQEQRQLNHRENRISRAISRDKHNGH